MVRIYLETGKNTTSEYVFVDTIIRHLGISPEMYEIKCVSGKDSLHLMENKMKETTLEGGKNLVIFDADSPENGGGFEKRKFDILHQLEGMRVDASLFLFPDNQNDGDVEVLMETLVQKDKHRRFFRCYSSYEMCLGDEYQAPNLKGKLHTYITAQKGLTKKQRNSIGNGQWLFENKDYWDIDRDTLTPLKDFILKAF